MKLDEIARAAMSGVDTIHVVRTAVNPLLWLVGLTTPLFLLAAVLIDDRPIRLLLIALAALFVFSVVAACFIFIFRDPDRLQSEEYRIRQRAIQILSRIGGASQIVDVATQEPRFEIERKRKEPKDG